MIKYLFWTNLVILSVLFFPNRILSQVELLELNLNEAYKQEDYLSVIKICQKLQKEHELEQDWDEYITKYCFIGHAYWILDKQPLMEIYLDSADYMANKMELDSFSPAWGYIWNYSGFYYYEEGIYNKSATFFEKNLAFQIKLNVDSLDIAYGYQNIASIWDIAGDFQKAIDSYKIALIYMNDFKDEQARIFNNLALAYQNFGDNRKALVAYQRALSILSKRVNNTEEKELKTAIYTNLATIYSDLNYLDSSYYYLALSKPLLLSNDSLAIADYYQILGTTEKRARTFKTSEKHLRKALRIRMDLLPEKHPDIAISFRELGEFLMERGLFKEALPYFQKGIITLSKNFTDSTSIEINPTVNASISNKRELKKNLMLKARILHKLNKLSLAKSTYLLTLDFADQLRNSYQAQGSKYILLKETIELFDNAIQLATQLKDHNLAFQLMERAKSTLLLESIKNTQAKTFAGLPDSLLQKEENFKKEIVQKERNLAEAIAGKADTTIATLNRTLFDLRENHQKFVKQLEVDFPQYHQLKYAVTFPTIEEVQREIVGKEEALIEYFMGDSSIYVFLIEKQQYHLLQLPKPIDLTEQITTIRTLLGNPSIEQQAFIDFAKVSTSLTDVLILPVLEQLSPAVKKLTIIPDGALAYLPFQTFFSHPVNITQADLPRYDTLPYLIKDFTINYAYSSTLLLNQFHQTKTNNSLADFAGFAPSFANKMIAGIRGNSLGALSHNQSEVEQIKALIGGETYLNTQATSTNFKEIANQYKILHLSTHAASHNDPIQTKIHFTDDYLTIKDIYNLSLNAELTVLSACETSLGKLQQGEGVISLERAFIYAGCPSLVTSLWQVDDEVTANLMVDFYKNLKTGMTKPDALQNTQLVYLNSTKIPEQAHPFYWASFIQTGNAAALFEPFFSIKMVASFGMVLLLGLIILYFLRDKIGGLKKR